MEPHEDDLERELNAGDPAARLHEEFAQFEREFGAEAAAAASRAVARLLDAVPGDELRRMALDEVRRGGEQSGGEA